MHARRLNSNTGFYTVSFATDQEARIDLSIDAKNTKLKEAGTSNDGWLESWVLLGLLVAITFWLGLLTAGLRPSFLPRDKTSRNAPQA